MRWSDRVPDGDSGTGQPGLFFNKRSSLVLFPALSRGIVKVSDTCVPAHGHVPIKPGLPKRAGLFVCVSQPSGDGDRREGDHEYHGVGFVLHQAFGPGSDVSTNSF